MLYVILNVFQMQTTVMYLKCIYEIFISNTPPLDITQVNTIHVSKYTCGDLTNDIKAFVSDTLGFCLIRITG